MSSTEHIDPELVEMVALVIEAHTDGDWHIEPLAQAVTELVCEKLKAQAVPEGQEYAYRIVRKLIDGRIVWDGTLYRFESAARRVAEALRFHTWWVERALLGTWERVEQ